MIPQNALRVAEEGGTRKGL
ncbi:Pentatricopeptide repeat-containing protein [Zea mays]|nr:Pentatricopeptide repeat-containing protein [Zea mays]